MKEKRHAQLRKNGVKQSMKKYGDDNFIEDQNMDGVDPECDATYGSDYDAEGEATYGSDNDSEHDTAYGSDYNPEDDSAFAPEYADETGHEQEGAELNSDDYDLERSEFEETEFEGADSDETQSEEEEEPYYDQKAFKWLRAENRAKFIKLMSMLVLATAILIFASIAWFTMNTATGTNGMGVSTASDPYQIVPLDGNTSIFQNYYDYMSGNQDGSMVWKMTADNNMENYTGDTGISPGSYGVVSFYVKPRDASINLDLSFEIVGYKYTETTQAAEEEGEDPVVTRTMTPVSAELQGYLAGHIFLFETRTPVYDDPTSENKKIISYIYSDPILSTTEVAKVISNRTFNKTGENTPVDIYWVWPKTLSTLVDATENTYVTIEPFCKNGAYTAVVNNVTSYPTRFLYQYSDTETTLTAALISSQYETYGDLYDRADNEIGLNVSYITLKMTSKETIQTAP